MILSGSDLERFHVLMVQDMMLTKEQGQSKFNRALESGEKLYPNTSTEGREMVHQELRSLREQWESYTDGISDANRRLSQALTRWTTFDETYEQLVSWVKDTEYGLASDLELKNTLAEKKSMLQHYRVHLSLYFKLVKLHATLMLVMWLIGKVGV